MKISILFLCFFISSEIAANHIVYPGGSCPVIVQSGKTIDILYNHSGSSSIDSIILEGPYNRVILPSDIHTGRFEYDNYTKSAINTKIVARIPSNTPEELYDLVVICKQEISISKKAVKVVKKFREKHRFIHISDPHISRQWVGTPENGYAKELELLDRFIEVANIISPDFIIVTGDLIHDYTLINADSLGWGGRSIKAAGQSPSVEEKYKNYFEGAGGFSGILGFNAPVFSTTGNHDFYGIAVNDYPAKSLQWNRLLGKRVYGFSYGDTRIIASDDFLGDPVLDIPADSPMSGLQGEVLETFLTCEGPGKLRIWAKHNPQQIDTTFVDKHKINLVIDGHSHDPALSYIGKNNVLNIRPGAVCRSGEIKDWKMKLGFFRIFTINGDTFEYSQPTRFCINPTAAYNDLQLNLTLHYKHENKGLYKENEALLNNLFDIDLPDCRIRFVMPKGKYKVSKGSIYQVIENEKYSVLDVLVDLKAKSFQTIKVSKR
ncbi:MAG: metallophosphoesterase [Tannerella sp.]|jgi:predicted MPP superfamily phosphohydrolase|nr:metallophosphoesterase [Tannerella sp.]